MPLAFYSQNQNNNKNTPNDKKNNGSILDKIGSFFAGNTAKLANTAVSEAKQIGNTGNMLAANLTNNPTAFKNANQASQNDYKNDNTGKGGFFNQGTVFKTPEEAQSGALTTGLKRIGGTTLGAATEVVPFAKGASLGLKAADVAAGGSKALDAIKTGAKLAGEGATYGVVGGAGNSIANDQPLTVQSELKDALTGAGMQLGGYGAGKLVQKGAQKTLDNISPVYAHSDEITPLDTKTTTPNIAHADLAKTTPDQAKALIAATPKPISDIKPIDKAKVSIVGEVPKEESTATTSVGQGAQHIADKLDQQLSTFGTQYSAPKDVLEKLNQSTAVTSKARKNDWLNHYEDTASVAGRHFGQVGTDLVYKLAEGAKQVSDIQELARPSVDNAMKLLDKASKSKAGRADIQSRIYSALENRDSPDFNPDQYLRTPQEKEMFDQTSKVLDYFKQQREARGKDVVGQNYSPRSAVSSALDAPQRLLQDAQSAFSTDVKSKFSKQRSTDIPDAEINKNIIDLLPQYVSSQAKEFGYEGAMNYAKENLPKVNPAYLTDPKSRRQGEEYIRTLFSQVLDPASTTASERLQNKIIGNTYKAQLGLSPKFAFQNMTQRFATRAAVSREAVKLSKVMDKNDIDALRTNMTSGSNPITGESTATAEGLNTKKPGILQKIDPGMKVEKGNVVGAYDKGAAQAIVNSQPYKDAIKSGMKPKDAASQALKDPAVADLASRHGNTVVNDTQFGANFVTKPEFFRKSGTMFGLSDKWFKQYQRFPQGMIQNMSTILRGNDARALDILKRGNLTETPLVDYLRSAQSLHNGVSDLITGIKNGEVHDVSLDVAKGYQDSLGKAVNELNKQIKAHSQIRGGKTVKSIAKMWAAASAIQFLFDGGLSMTGDNQNSEIGKSLKYGSPISIPSKDQNPLASAVIPSSPFDTHGFNTRKALNLVPGVGLAVNRGRDISKFASALLGGQ